jgi:hypothetical protein
MEERLHRIGHRIGLHHVSNTEGGDARKEGEQKPERPGSEAPGEIVHGPPAHRPEAVLFAVLHGQDRLGKLGGHADQARYPHPEKGARSSGGQGGRDARDVPRPHRCGQGGHQGLEMGDVALLGVRFLSLDQGEVEGMKEGAKLETPEPKGEVDACPQQKNEHRRAPEDLVDPVEQGEDLLFHGLHPLTSHGGKAR